MPAKKQQAPYGVRADGTPRAKPGPRVRLENCRNRSLRVADVEWDTWHAAAAAEGISVSEAARRLLNAWAADRLQTKS